MKVFVYQRNGKEWADFTAPPDTKITRVIECSDAGDALAKAKKETGRVAAVLERCAGELPQFKPPQEIAKSGLMRRLKWLATGK